MKIAEFLKSWWPLVVIAGFLIAFSANLQSLWGMPQKVSKMEESIEDLAVQLQTYTAANEAANEQRDQMIKLLTQIQSRE